jgi:hypothetical protein
MTDAPARVWIYLPDRESPHRYWWDRPPLDHLEDLTEYTRTDIHTAAIAERDGWQNVTGSILATVPVDEVLCMSGTVKDSVKYFRGLHDERDALRAKAKAADEMAQAFEDTIITLEEEIHAAYPVYLLKYAHNIRKKANDMETPSLARAALAAYRKAEP